MSRSGVQAHSRAVTTIWSSRAIGAILASAALGMAAPAQACSCIPPENVEEAGRAALGKADLVAELEIGRVSPQPRLYCTNDGRARLWFRPGMRIERDHPARVIRIIKGSVSGPIRLRDDPVMSINGECATVSSTCQVGIRPGRTTGPMLLRRVAPGVFRPLDICTQYTFNEWFARQRRAGQVTP